MTQKRMTPCLLLAALPALLAAPRAQAAAPAQPIQVVLNGTALRFAHTPPTQIQGSTLVPMRDIFEALGATVRFDKATQTVYGQKGQTAIVLPLGSLTATVNGHPRRLPQPARLVAGTVLVPLGFISQALGASVSWQPAIRTVSILTVDPHLNALPVPPTAAQNGPVSGQVTGIYTDTTPSKLTLRVGGRNTVVPLSANTIVLRSVTGQPATQVALAALKVGDQVAVQRDDAGTATVVTATFGEVRGTVVGMGTLASGDAVLTLDSGRVVELVPNAPVSFDGRSVALSDVKKFEKVVIRTNPSDSLGYGVAVQTADNPDPTPPGVSPAPAPPAPAHAVPAGDTSSVEVTSFTDDVSKPLKAGQTITATLSGTPGGKATFAIPGVAEDIPMRETAPGVYTGTYTVKAGAAASKAAVLGKLVAAGVTSTLIQAPGQVTIDSQPPRVTDFGPARDTTVESDHPLIYATVTDEAGVGVNPDATRVSLDGKDVTADAAVTGSLFTYKPAQPLASGGHTVSLLVADGAGNAATTVWGFKVSTGKIIQSFTTNEPAGQAVGAGATVVFTLNAQPGGTATASVGTLAKSLPLAEADPGVYTGEYTIRAGDSVENAPVTARFTARDGTQVTTSLPTGLTVAAGPPPAPRITEPPDAAYVDASVPLAVRGKAAPGSTVRVVVTYVSKALGGILPVSGQSATKDVTANTNGDWLADGLSLKIQTLLFGNTRDTVFTVTAIRLDASGSPASDAAKITLRPG